MKPHERWWQDHLDTRMGDFGTWLHNSDTTSRDGLYRFVESNKTRTVLECGSGLCIDYQRFFAHQNPKAVRYDAIDVTPRLVTLGRSLGANVREASIEAIPAKDGAYEMVYCRHVLEHLPGYEAALTEMLRVASRFAIAILWRTRPTGEDTIEYNTVHDVPNTYHNTYSEERISAWLTAQGIEHHWYGESDRTVLMRK